MTKPKALTPFPNPSKIERPSRNTFVPEPILRPDPKLGRFNVR